jgi:hippurate hydrolase
VNDEVLAGRLAVGYKQLLGEESVVTEFPPATGSEDVHLLISPFPDVPFSYTIVGIANPEVFAEARAAGKVMPFSAHNPNFVVDLSAIPVGTETASIAMLDLLGK